MRPDDPGLSKIENLYAELKAATTAVREANGRLNRAEEELRKAVVPFEGQYLVGRAFLFYVKYNGQIDDLSHQQTRLEPK